jgi:RNA polymerase sigma-70 factor (ECF subfamily)
MARKPLENAVACVRALVAAQEAEDQSDQDLVQAFSTKNDKVAFAALVKRHGPMVFSVCMRLLHQIQDAEDAFQAVFIVLARYASSLGKRESLSGWLHQVSCRVAQHARRAAQRRQFHESKVRVRLPTIMPPKRDAYIGPSGGYAAT